MKVNPRLAAIAVLAAVAAIASFAGPASAALPEILPAPTKEAPVTFTGEAESVVTYFSPFPEVRCTHGTLTGQFTTAKEVTATMVWKQCKTQDGLNKPLYTSPGNTETFTSNQLKGVIGYVNKSKTEVGLRLEGTDTKKDWASNAKIGTAQFYMEGELIGGVTPVNSFTRTGTLTHQETGGFPNGKQAIRAFEGAPLSEQNQELTGDSFEDKKYSMPVRATWKLTWNKEVKIKA
jgi:hypothetical protein